MAYDESTAARARALLEREPDLVERRMFSGLGWMLGGNMACGMVTGGLLVRIDRAEYDGLMQLPGTGPFEMGDRTGTGWIVVDPQVLDDDADLVEWVGRGVAYARSLPPK